VAQQRGLRRAQRNHDQRNTTNPGSFVVEGEKLYLLTVQGSETPRYKNVLKSARLESRRTAPRVNSRRFPSGNPCRCRFVAGKFREKYGTKDVKEYHSKFDVAVRVQVG
jgi:hypothetical protein